jgi:hypothetical protein
MLIDSDQSEVTVQSGVLEQPVMANNGSPVERS